MSKFAGHDLRVSADFAASRQWHSPFHDVMSLTPIHPTWPIGPITQTGFTGTVGPDSYTGGSGADTFHMEQGGNDTVKGKGGNDLFFFGDTLTAADRVDGGTDGGGVLTTRDSLLLVGDYSGGVVFGAATVVNIEYLSIGSGFSCKLTVNEATVAAGQSMLVNGASIGAGLTFTFNSTAETDGTYLIYGAAGLDKITGGVTSDLYQFFGGCLTAADRVDGGVGDDNQLTLSGDYSAGLVLASATIRNIDKIQFGNGGNYNLTMSNGNLAAGAVMDVVMGFGPSDHATFDGSAELDGSFNIGGGVNNDVLTGGHGNDSFVGNGSADRMTGGAGNDFFYYVTVSDSTSTGYDTLVGFNFLAQDQIGFAGTVTGIDAKIRHGTLSAGTFDANLAAKVNAAHLAADHAVVYTPDAGGLAGSIFLIIDTNHTAGYQAGADLVIALESPVNLTSIDTTDFT